MFDRLTLDALADHVETHETSIEERAIIPWDIIDDWCGGLETLDGSGERGYTIPGNHLVELLQSYKRLLASRNDAVEKLGIANKTIKEILNSAVESGNYHLASLLNEILSRTSPSTPDAKGGV